MNDEFLHRLRKAPRPEFLSELKARLERQPLSAPAAPPTRRRLTFTRGLLTGLLLGGTAFVFAVIEGKGIVPEPIRAAVLAPGHLVEQLFSGEPKSAAANPNRVAPLGPAWLPRHRGSDNPATMDSAPIAEASASTSKPSAATSNNKVPNTSVAPPTYTILAGNSVHFIVSEVSTFRGRYLGRINVEREADESIASIICGPARGGAKATMVVLTRHLSEDEVRGCRSNSFLQTEELKIGYTALALARSPLYGPLRLTSRDLFLGLAQRIPDPGHPDTFIDNPNLTWNQVNSALPYDRIQVLGPAPDSDQGRLAAELFLETGCKLYPGASDEVCHTLRSDGAYIVAANPGEVSTDQLVGNPTLLAVLSVGQLTMTRDKLAVSPIDGIELGATGYPASRAVYLSSTNDRNGGLGNMAHIYLQAPTPDRLDWYTWGFMNLGAAESAASNAQLRSWGFK